MLTVPHRSLFAGLIVAGLCSFSGCVTTEHASAGLEANAGVIVPPWAPPYDDVQFVRYYYLPDIEVYYDVWDVDFVYLHEGNWLFSRTFPPLYPGFDLYNCFVVVLDERVYEPWTHHYFYASHYPRYYYHSVYNVVDAREVRGFNENREREIRLEQREQRRLGDASKARREHEQILPIAREAHKVESTKPPQRVKYSGGEVGKPVKVEKEMTKPRKQNDRK